MFVEMNRRGRPPEQVPTEDSDRWAEIREKSRMELGREVGKLSGLDVVAWLSGMGDIDDALDEAVKVEIKAGASWKAIAVALGESGDRESVHRVRGRFFNRLK